VHEHIFSDFPVINTYIHRVYIHRVYIHRVCVCVCVCIHHVYMVLADPTQRVLHLQVRSARAFAWYGCACGGGAALQKARHHRAAIHHTAHHPYGTGVCVCIYVCVCVRVCAALVGCCMCVLHRGRCGCRCGCGCKRGCESCIQQLDLERHTTQAATQFSSVTQRNLMI